MSIDSLKRTTVEIAYVWSWQFMIAFMAMYAVDLIMLHRCPAQHDYFEEAMKRWSYVFLFSGIIHLGVEPIVKKYNPQ